MAIRNVVHRVLKIGLLFILSFSLAFGWIGSAAPWGKVYAASKQKLSASKVTITVGKTKTLKLKNAGRKVKWTTSNKKIVAVTKKRGKHGAVITLKAKKAGKCTITAKIGKKKYKCKVTIKKKKVSATPVTPVIPGEVSEWDREIRTKPLSSSSVELSSEYSHDKSLGKDASAEFSIAVTDFSLKMLSELAKNSDGNILISPDSILTAMIMTENGAGGNTLTEMEDVLSGGIGISDFNAYLAGLNNRICSSDKVVYQTANSIWIRNNMQVNAEFARNNKMYHNTEFYTAPFNQETVDDINNWVFNNSRNMIDQIIDRLGADARMVLVNTTAFEGKWAQQFQASNKENFRAWYGTSKAAMKTAEMMAESESYRYITLNGGEGFAKPYAGNEIAFVGLLPPEGKTPSEYIEGMTGEDFINAWNAGSNSYKHLNIKIPVFSYDYDASLEDVLKAMGLSDAFTDNADFSGITEGESLSIDEVRHKTHIEVDKLGTKAAAATAVIVKSGATIGEVKKIYLDRPFVYALVDAKTGIPLFIGIVETP